jgi:hypothetical protein
MLMGFDLSELSREKSLVAIRLKARQIPSSRFNVWCVVGVAILSILYVSLTRSSASVLATRTRELAEMGFNFSIGILGFLIAGFTVFATITKENLFRAMALVPRQGTGLSTLKYNLFAFMRVFIDYLLFASLCMTVKIVAAQGGALSELISLLPGSDDIRHNLSRVGFATFVTLLVYILIILKSFVFNIYGFVITTIQWSFLTTPPEEDPDLAALVPPSGENTVPDHTHANAATVSSTSAPADS